MILSLPDDLTELGEVLFSSIDQAYGADAAMCRVQSNAVRRYLRGERGFRIYAHDSYGFGTGKTLFEVSLGDDELMHEELVSDVSLEIGKQQGIDIGPAVKRNRLTLQSVRDKAVAMGALSYGFSQSVVYNPSRAFHKIRVEEGLCGLAVMDTAYPGIGWGLKVISIPSDELVFLPIGVAHPSQVSAIVWRKWVTVDFAKRVLLPLRDLNNEPGCKVRSWPELDGRDKDKLGIRKVPFGAFISASGDQVGGGSIFSKPSGAGSAGGGDSERNKFQEFVLLSQTFVSDDMVHLSSRTVQCGRYVLAHCKYRDHERPQMPIATAVYADVGGPYGRSYAFPRLTATLRSERLLAALMRNFEKLDVYGLVAASKHMNINLDDSYMEGDGFKLVNYASDPNYPQSVPTQIGPIPLARIVGNLPALVSGLGSAVFPQSKLSYGKSEGRIDSDAAIQRLEALGHTAIRAGAETARSAWIQIYRAGLEMMRNHFEEGESVPILTLSPELAGVIVDVEELPQSLEQEEDSRRGKLDTARRALASGQDPLIAISLLESLEGPGYIDGKQLVPVPRFRIGPNIIPHPNVVDIDIKALMPRDENREFAEIAQALQLQMSSVMEAIIEIRRRGMDRYTGGEAIINTYELVMLNLLSAYGNGIEAGPIVATPGTYVPRVAHWVVSTFMSSVTYALASDRVKQQVSQLLEIYNMTNVPAQTISADEAAMLQTISDQSRLRGQAAVQGGNPTLAGRRV